MALPTDVRRLFGYALSLAQAGDQHDAAKVLKGFGSAGVLEIVEDDAGGTYRAVYSRKPYLSCTASRRRASAESPRRKRIWTSSAPG